MALTPRDAYLRRVYGITEAQYDEVLEHQGGACAICRKPPAAGKNLHVDHDHKTGAVRGLLCMPCNHHLIGRYRDPQLFFRAGEYLTSPPALAVVGAEHTVPKRRARRRRKRSSVRE